MSKHASLVLCFRNIYEPPEKQEALLVYEMPSDRFDLKPSWRWGLPGGKCCNDKLKTGNCCSESPEETAIREMHKETGYKITVELLFSDECVHPESREKFMRYTFLGKIIGGRQLIIRSPLGLISPRWFILSAFPKNSHKSHQLLIKRYFGNGVK